MTTLRDVLNAFENANGTLSLNELARQLDLTPGMLEGMLDYWVRKGKLRERGSGATCATCGSAKTCHYTPNMPRSYELATADPVVPACACDGCQAR